MPKRDGADSGGERSEPEESAGVRPNPEVEPKAMRRRFTAEYKERVLREADRCEKPGDLGALLRREGLYSSHLAKWRAQRSAGLKPRKRGRKAKDAVTVKRVAQLEREVAGLRNSCLSEASSLAWRTFGGPQGAVWSNTDNTERSCLVAAHATASTLVDDSLAAVDNCLAGDACDAAALAGERAVLAAAATADIGAACGELDRLIALDAATYVQRADHQVDCITATGHADTGSLSLSGGRWRDGQLETLRTRF